MHNPPSDPQHPAQPQPVPSQTRCSWSRRPPQIVPTGTQRHTAQHELFNPEHHNGTGLLPTAFSWQTATQKLPSPKERAFTQPDLHRSGWSCSQTARPIPGSAPSLRTNGFGLCSALQHLLQGVSSRERTPRRQLSSALGGGRGLLSFPAPLDSQLLQSMQHHLSARQRCTALVLTAASMPCYVM